jgi:hypothetical protein
VAIQTFLDRIRVRQGPSGTAGMWLFQTAPNADRAFVGMSDNNKVGLWGSTIASFGLLMDTTTGNVGISTPDPGFKLDIGNRIRLRQGKSASAGLYLFQNGPKADQAFIGMQADPAVGHLDGLLGVGHKFFQD